MQKVVSVIKANVKNCPDIKPEDDLVDELGIDSLDTLIIINTIEDEFNIEFDSADLYSLKTVSDIVGILENKYIKTKVDYEI